MSTCRGVRGAAIYVSGNADRGVPEKVSAGLNVDTRLKPRDRSTVPQRVHADVGNASLLGGDLHRPQDVTWVDGRAQLGSDGSTITTTPTNAEQLSADLGTSRRRTFDLVRWWPMSITHGAGRIYKPASWTEVNQAKHPFSARRKRKSFSYNETALT